MHMQSVARDGRVGAGTGDLAFNNTGMQGPSKQPGKDALTTEQDARRKTGESVVNHAWRGAHSSGVMVTVKTRHRHWHRGAHRTCQHAEEQHARH